MSEEIKSCPLCGALSNLDSCLDEANNTEYFLRCAYCNLQLTSYSKDKIIERWNRRVCKDVQQLKNIFKKLQKDVDYFTQNNGSTLAFKDMIKNKFDGFLMTVQNYIDEAIN